MIELSNDYIEFVKHLKLENNTFKTVIETKEKCYGKVLINGNEYKEAFNDKEPYALFTHVFFIPEYEYLKNPLFTFQFKNKAKKSIYFSSLGEEGKVNLAFDEKDVFTAEELIENDDHKIKIQSTELHTLAMGAEYAIIRGNDPADKPIVMFAMFADPKYISFHTGTPDDGYEYINKKQTVKGEAYAAINNGHDVIAAFNADFFDMFGNFKPAGVCIKNSKTVCGEDSGRPFFGILDDNTPVISDFSKNPEYLGKLKSAVSGREIFLRNGQLNDLSLLEAFSYIRHPRTCAAVLKDGRFMILVVDGRLPEYSNGASIVDLARIMQGFGAVNAINLDGGGSCTFLIKDAEDFKLLNTPADLHRPTDKLIREVFDTILLTKLK